MTERLRVLIVEDRPSDAELMVLRLEAEGFDPDWVRVDTEPEYRAALETAPDVILSDWRLPRFSGQRALQIAREHAGDIPLVIVSGAIGEEAAVDALHEGAGDYVFKDRMARLGPAIRRALEERRLRVEQRQAELELRQAAMVFESSTEGVTLTALDGTILTVNHAFEEITGYSAAEVVGQNARILQSGHHDPTFYRNLWATIKAEGRWRGEIWNRRKDGEAYPEWLTISAVKNVAGETTNYVGVFTDTGDIKRAQEQLDFLASHDALTGLPNRALFQDRLDRALLRAAADSEVVAVLSVDMDAFGKVNDGLSHAVGDGLLQAIGQRLAEGLGPEDSLARFSGDEFAIVLGRASDAPHVASLIREFQGRVARPYNIDGHEIVITCSVGVSLFPTDGTDAPTLLRQSEAAMRRAKLRGRDAMDFADVGVLDSLGDGMVLERQLRAATANREFVVHYQPQVDLANRSLVAVEALVHWESPERGLVPPNDFISITEQLGIINEIGGWVMGEACRQIAAWRADGFEVPRVAVNLSGQQLDRWDLPVVVSAALGAAGIGPERLELEVTESVVMRHGGGSTVLADLRALGVELAMDDFGTGYSSLSELRNLPLRRLKIDISFVRGIGDPAAEAIIRAIIAMAGSLELQTVAEGVETEEQALFLREAGCDIGQGYLFDRALSPADLQRAWFRRPAA